jgi:hypothetical protein
MMDKGLKGANGKMRINLAHNEITHDVSDHLSDGARK